MKEIACIISFLFLIFSCKSKDEPTNDFQTSTEMDLVTYTEKDTLSSFLNTETLKVSVTRITKSSVHANRTYCEAFLVTEIRNLTNKNVSVKFGRNSAMIVKAIDISPKQTVTSDLNLCGGVFCGVPVGCEKAEKVTTVMFVTYN